MEIVKKLKGSEDEDESFYFEEINLYQEEKETKKKRKILLPLLGIISITTIGYFGFKQLQTDTTQKIQEDNIVTTINTPPIINKPEKISTEPEKKIVIANKEPFIKEVAIKKNPLITSVEPVIVKKEKPIVYTEVLALSHKEIAPKTTIEKPIIKTTPKPIIKEEKEKIVISQAIKSKPVLTKKIPKRQTIKIRKGDSLAVLAKRYYGNSLAFQGIIRANESIKDHKSKLKIGQKIIILVQRNPK